MILVDTSVWVDYLRGTATWQADRLDALLDTDVLGIGDLNLTEVLQGCRSDSDFRTAERLLGRLEFVVLGGADVATLAAQHDRKLRRLGVTVRGTLDVIVATRCIVGGHRLLHDDRDFDAFEQHLGLRCVTA